MDMHYKPSDQHEVPYKILPTPNLFGTSATTSDMDFDSQEATNGTNIRIIRNYWDIISLQWVRIIIMVVTLLAVVIAILGNILVILVIHRRRSLRRNPTILFILNLAVCDIISCLIYRPLLLMEMFLPFTPYFDEIVNHLHKCKVASYFKALFAAVGFHIMVAISQERLLLIVYPLRAKIICTVNRTAKILCIIWITAMVLVLPGPLKYTEIISVDINGVVINFCGYFSGEKHAIVYHSLMFAFYFAIPLIILTVSYIKIFNVLYRRQDGLEVNTEAGGGKSMRIRRNLAKMMVSVSVIFAVCWGPHFIFFLHVACGGKVPKNGFFTATVVEFLPIISSILNPLLYTLNSRTFRTGIKSILFRRSPPDVETSGLRSFANAENVTQSTRRSTFLGFSSFRMGGSKGDQSFRFKSPEQRIRTQTNGSHCVGINRTDSFGDSGSSSSAGTSRRAAFNNNNFELTQKSTEVSPFLGDISEKESSNSSSRHFSTSPEPSVS